MCPVASSTKSARIRGSGCGPYENCRSSGDAEARTPVDGCELRRRARHMHERSCTEWLQRRPGRSGFRVSPSPEDSACRSDAPRAAVLALRFRRSASRRTGAPPPRRASEKSASRVTTGARVPRALRLPRVRGRLLHGVRVPFRSFPSHSPNAAGPAVRSRARCSGRTSPR